MDDITLNLRELHSKLMYILWCSKFEKNPQTCQTHKEYMDWITKETLVHHGDCTKQPCSCERCLMVNLEIDAENALNSIIIEKGYCGKKCIQECGYNIFEEKETR